MSIWKLLLIIIVIGGVVFLLTTPQAKAVMGRWGKSAAEDAGFYDKDPMLGSEVKVFLPRNTAYYHADQECPELLKTGQEPVRMQLAKAKAVAEPCPVCDAPR